MLFFLSTVYNDHMDRQLTPIAIYYIARFVHQQHNTSESNDKLLGR